MKNNISLTTKYNINYLFYLTTLSVKKPVEFFNYNLDKFLNYVKQVNF